MFGEQIFRQGQHLRGFREDHREDHSDFPQHIRILSALSCKHQCNLALIFQGLRCVVCTWWYGADFIPKVCDKSLQGRPEAILSLRNDGGRSILTPPLPGQAVRQITQQKIVFALDQIKSGLKLCFQIVAVRCAPDQ